MQESGSTYNEYNNIIKYAPDYFYRDGRDLLVHSKIFFVNLCTDIISYDDSFAKYLTNLESKFYCCPIAALTPDIISYLFSLLPDYAALKQVRQVNQEWRAIANTHIDHRFKHTPRMTFWKIVCQAPLDEIEKCLIQDAANEFNINRVVNFVTLAELSAENGRADVVKELASRGASLAQRSPNNFSFIFELMSAYENSSPLERAAHKGHVKVVQELLKRKVGCDRALRASVLKGHFYITLLLVMHGANVNDKFTKNGSTALTVACAVGNVEVAKYLVENGAEFDWSSDELKHEFSNAFATGNYDLTHYLIQQGADVLLLFDSSVIWVSDKVACRQLLCCILDKIIKPDMENYFALQALKQVLEKSTITQEDKNLLEKFEVLLDRTQLAGRIYAPCRTLIACYIRDNVREQRQTRTVNVTP